MENGDSLNLVSPLSNSCTSLSFMAEILRQGALLLPVPSSKDSLFALFRTEIDKIVVPQQNYLPKNLYYSLINMKFNNGLGKVIIKNRIIVNDTLDGGNINAVRHANGKDWWIITRKFISDKFFTFRFSASQIDSSFTQSIGEPTSRRTQGGGQAVFSPDGSKYAYFTAIDQLMLYDFNRVTGKLSNFRRVVIPTELGGSDFLISSISISPNSKYLYLFAIKEIIQLDLQAIDMPNSIIRVATHDPIAAPFAFPTNSQLAPDCKIYFTSTNGLQWFGYIRYPDRKGVACQVVQGGIRLPFNVAIVGGMPNNPNYRLGVTPTHPCDSTIDFRVATQEALLPKVNFVLFPNPATNELNIDFDPINGETKAEITLYNLLGSKVGQQKLDLINTPLSINVANLPSGMYTAVLQIKGRSPAAQKFVIVR